MEYKMQAIILAAGMGKRLLELTKNNTKCMIKVNGVTLIERMLHQLEKQNLSKIVIVIGYEGEKLRDYIDTLNITTPIEYVNNPIYDKTNNIYSLALAKDYLCNEDTLLFESDLIFEDAVIDELIKDSRDTLALVDKYESWMDGTCIKLSEDDLIESFVPGSQLKYNECNDYYKTVNIYKFSKHFSKTHYVPFLEAYQKALGKNEYYEQVLRVITMLDEPEIKAKRLCGQKWYEIDDIQDLDIASSMFTTNEDEKVELFQKRYGGYWRYPRLIDFCYLVNPFFPSQKMFDEMKASFEILISQYPSGMRVNSLLAAKHFGINQENVLIGNGAAELIKAIMNNLSGDVGFISPTFEEYPNRYSNEASVFFHPNNDDYSYSGNDVIEYFQDKSISGLVIVNPDNPTGNYIPKKELLKIIEWSNSNKIHLIIDESFIDFADEVDCSIIEQELLDRFSFLYIIKSISKSYGVPGIRLGVIASGNTEMIESLKKEVAIWNINSFGEFFMQIIDKYNREYRSSLNLIRMERSRFNKRLNNIAGIRTIPSQANYIMIELTTGQKSYELTKYLLVNHDILVKDLSSKLGDKQYLRIAVRKAEDNDKLLYALTKYFV